ncbi:hypothetical protein AMTRI_Chr10g232520 [Amborella trichopoda]
MEEKQPLEITTSEKIPSDPSDKHPLLVITSPATPTRATLHKHPSVKNNCLCSPTTHVGSFRCRHHRASHLSRHSNSFNSLADLPQKPSSDSTIGA